MNAIQSAPPVFQQMKIDKWVRRFLPTLVILFFFGGCIGATIYGIWLNKHNGERFSHFVNIGRSIVSYCRNDAVSTPLRLEQFVELGVISQADLIFLHHKRVNATYYPPNRNTPPDAVVLKGLDVRYPDTGIEVGILYSGKLCYPKTDCVGGGSGS